MISRSRRDSVGGGGSRMGRDTRFGKYGFLAGKKIDQSNSLNSGTFFYNSVRPGLWRSRAISISGDSRKFRDTWQV